MTWLHLITIIDEEMDKENINQFDEVTFDELVRILNIAAQK